MKWKDITGFENKYQICLSGFVRSLNYNNTGNFKLLKPKINKQGHLEVTLSKHNKPYYKMVARLMIETFTNIKLTKNDIIMYKDNDKTNCSLDNLYLISRGERQELTYEQDHRHRLKYEYYGTILPIKDIAHINNISPRLIRSRITRLYWNIYEAAEIPKSIINKKEGIKYETKL